jgi:hypothetical protein
MILAIVFLSTGHSIWLVFIAITAGAHALRVWMLPGAAQQERIRKSWQ